MLRAFAEKVKPKKDTVEVVQRSPAPRRDKAEREARTPAVTKKRWLATLTRRGKQCPPQPAAPRPPPFAPPAANIFHVRPPFFVQNAQRRWLRGR